MKEIGDSKECPHCGFHADTPQIAPYLPIRTVLANRYLVGKLLEYNDGRIAGADEEHIHVAADSKLHNTVQGKRHSTQDDEDQSRVSIVGLLVAASFGHAEEQSYEHQQHVPHAGVSGQK